MSKEYQGMKGDSETISRLMERVTWLESRDVALRALLHDWQTFATDVSAADCGGQDWLDGLRGRTKAALEQKP